MSGNMCIHLQLCPVQFQASIVGSVVECSPATRAARVRFPDDAILFFAGIASILFCFLSPALAGFGCNRAEEDGRAATTQRKKKKKFWRRGVSIPVPLTC